VYRDGPVPPGTGQTGPVPTGFANPGPETSEVTRVQVSMVNKKNHHRI
jgi:hypothetical protein